MNLGLIIIQSFLQLRNYFFTNFFSRSKLSFNSMLERPPFIQPTYISVGGFTYQHEKAIDKFRATCSQNKKPIPFVPAKPDYSRKRTHIDMKELMLARRKEKIRIERLNSRQRHDEKWTIEGGPPVADKKSSSIIIIGGR